MIVPPSVQELVHHLRMVPSEIVLSAEKAGDHPIHTEAVLNDVLRLLKNDLTAPKLFDLSPKSRTVHELRLIRLFSWILLYPFFRETDLSWIRRCIDGPLKTAAPLVPFYDWISDEERSEELIRTVLKSSGVVPYGETESEADDRYDSVNTVKRLRIIQETAEAMQRAEEIRRKMAEERAREAANVYGRE